MKVRGADETLLNTFLLEVKTMKTFSKAIAAIALMAAMTTCLTACEEDSVPAYGTIIDETNDTAVHHQIVTEPRYDETQVTQGADFMLINALIEQGSDGYEYLVLYTGITNLTGEERSPQDLVGVAVFDPDNTGLYYMRDSVGDYDPDNQLENINPGEQKLVLYAYRLPQVATDYVNISVHDHLYDDYIYTTTIYLTAE